jgi:hypothetical protein
VIVAAFVGLLTAYILTKVKKNYEWLVSYYLLWIDNLSNKVFNDSSFKKRNV